jgi:hypothetical protein
MKKQPVFAFLLGFVALVAFVTALHTRSRLPNSEPPPLETNLSSTPAASGARTELASAPRISAEKSRTALTPIEESAAVSNKLQRLNDIRDAFRGLAAGDATVAMRAANQLTNDNERESALLTLVTEWTRGELNPPSERAASVAAFGLEAGLGMELIKNPELALLWANELTQGPGQAALVRQIAISLARSDPAAALAFSAQVPENEREQFSRGLYAGWAMNDTAAALESADQMTDPTQHDAALQAIRQVAPVGIGAELRMQDGYPIINGLLPGTPAELSGQLHPGDRIVALAQGDNSFVQARSLSLADVVQMIRGEPGTTLQMQILPANAPPDSPPQTISIIRDQIKFKN